LHAVTDIILQLTRMAVSIIIRQELKTGWEDVDHNL
jgi:hypothetical protein